MIELLAHGAHIAALMAPEMIDGASNLVKNAAKDVASQFFEEVVVSQAKGIGEKIGEGFVEGAVNTATGIIKDALKSNGET